MASDYQAGAFESLFASEKKNKSLEQLFSSASAKKLSSVPTVVQVEKKGKDPKPRKRKSEGDDDDDEEEEKPKFSGPSRKMRSRREDESERKRDPEAEARTVFVGNLPNTVEKSKIKKLLAEFGKIETIRLRGAARPDETTTKRVACIKGEFHENRNNINAYVRFSDVAAAERSLAVNGKTFEEHVLRVDWATPTAKDNHKAVFVGNLPFAAEEDELRKHFSRCGHIEDVRIIRDTATGVGKGFGYVNLGSSSDVELALEMNGSKFMGRSLRVSRCVRKAKLSVPKSQSQNQKFSGKGNNKNSKKGGKSGRMVKGSDKPNDRKKISKKKILHAKANEFQGATFDNSNSKRPKKSRTDKKREVISKILQKATKG